MEKSALIDLIKSEISSISGRDKSHPIFESDFLSYLVDSIGTASLMISLEKKLFIRISDKDFYEAKIITLLDLSNFIHEKLQNTMESKA